MTPLLADAIFIAGTIFAFAALAQFVRACDGM